jgi:hypothetical protein
MRSATVIALVALVASLLGASSARAAGAAGPVDTSGIPIWYQDATGVQLAPCVLGPPNCFGTLANLAADGGEAFYANATADLPDPSGAHFKVVLAVEAANVNGGIVTFERIRVSGTGLAPNTTFNVSEPYGDLSVTSDPGGVVKDTTDVGCGLAPCNFAGALAGPLFDGFLQWDTAISAPPVGFIGDNVTPHEVIGSPLARNSVTITGGGLALFTDKFVVEGELAAGATPPGMLPPAAPIEPKLLPADDTGASHTDNITKLATPTIEGATVRGANVTLTVDGVVNGTGTALADGTYAVKLPNPLTDGIHVLTAVAANPISGARSQPSPAFTLTTDTTAPPAPPAPTTAQPLSAPVGAFFTGTAEAGAHVALFADGNPIGDGTAAADGGYSIKAAALGTGLHQITATATDVAGNTSAASPALALPVGSVDGIQPPSLSASSDSGGSSSDGITNRTEPTFVGAVSLANATVQLYDNGTPLGSATTSGGSYSITSSSELGDGQHLITAVVTDNASGLVSAPSAPLRITIDTVAPAPPSRPVAAQQLTAAGSLGVGGTAAAGSSIDVFVDGRHAASTTATDGNWSATLDGLSFGTHSIDASATDLAGNTSARSEALVVGPAAAQQPATTAAGADARLAALGALPVVHFHGRFGTVKATITVDRPLRLTLTGSDGRGRRLTFVRGSKLGPVLQRAARTSTMHAAIRRAGRVRIELQLDRSQLKQHGLYRLNVAAADATGHVTRLRIPFRVV